MKILAAKIRWNEGYCNNPDLEILVDKIPELKDLDYDVTQVRYGNEKSNLYLAIQDGYASFLSWSGKKNDGGYCGQEWQIIVNGKPVTVKGPWSSRSGVMNKAFKTQVMEVSITDDLQAYERGYTFCAGAMTVEKVLKEVLPFFHHSITLLRIVDKEGEITYVPVKLHEPDMKKMTVVS